MCSAEDRNSYRFEQLEDFHFCVNYPFKIKPNAQRMFQALKLLLRIQSSLFTASLWSKNALKTSHDKQTLFCSKCCMLVWWRVCFPLLWPEGSPRGGTRSAPLRGDPIQCPQRRRRTPRSPSRRWHWSGRGSRPQSWTRPQRCCHLWTCLHSRGQRPRASAV